MEYTEINSNVEQNVQSVMKDFIESTAKAEVKTIPLKDIYMAFLLALNEDFDDDLLFDAIDMMVDL
jgi:hypothetical protein